QLREKLEGAKARPHEYVKLLVQLAEAVVDVDEKVAFYREAANLYADKGNKAEAARINESIIEVDPADADARGYLRATYETQRKFDKLIDLMKLEAELLDDGPEKTEAYRQIAQLATERIKKPEVCIELWDVLLDQDPDDVEALQA